MCEMLLEVFKSFICQNTTEMLQIKFHILTIYFLINFMSVLSFYIDTNHTIVYEDVKSSLSRATYFGYSVVTHTGEEHWIHIGAPRGNSSYEGSVKEPGIVYRCQVGEICEEVNLRGTANEKRIKNENKTNAWIGVSMTIINGRNDQNVVVCGHRWINTTLPKTDQPRITGSCYMIPIDNNKTENQCQLVPVTGNYWFNPPSRGKRITLLNRIMGQAGISCHYPEKNEKHGYSDHLILGAPGILNWEGATVFYNVSQENTCGSYSSHIMEPPLNYYPYYFGYAVSSGHLLPNESLVYAVSAPRAYQGKGMVLLYHYTKEQAITPIIQITGTQIGEYFGASIATADINQDGIDDMIIGAPRYSTYSVPDKGCIYVSLGGEITKKKMRPITDGTRNSQFGITVAAVGDINNDGFEDIAVGAPYSNGNTGTVYFYRGGRSGLSLAQVIHADQINPSLRGFGISIHHTAETCDHSKTYMAIGAYLSGHVTVLRSYPVISLHIKLNSSINTIEKSNHQFSLTVCSWYAAPCGPSKISVTRNIELDHNYRRIHIKDDNRKKQSHEKMIILEKGQILCDPFDVFIREDKKKVENSIVIEASLTLNNYEQEKSTLLIKTDGTKIGVDKFCRNCSVVDQEQPIVYDTLKLPFSDCGDDEICNSELHLYCSFQDIVNGTFVIGSSGELKLHFVITNRKEPAYQTILHLQIPEPVRSLRRLRNCYENPSLTGTIMQCNLNSPLDFNVEDELTVEVDVSDIVEKELQSVTFNATLTTASSDSGSFDSCTLNLKLKAIADMYMIGKSTKDVVPYSSGTVAVFEQTYQVYKVGKSPVREAEINIDVPYLLKSGGEKKDFLSIVQLEVRQGSLVFQCKSDPPLSTSIYNAKMPENQEINSMETEHSRAKREMMIEQPEMKENISLSSSDNILYLNCTREDVVCQKIKCTSGFTDSKALLNIKLIAKLNTSTLGNTMKKKNIILLSTNGSVDVKDPKNLVNFGPKRMDIAFTTVSFVLEMSEKKVEVWVIAVSAVCGVILLVLIIIVLKKAGFFQREKKEALQKLLQSTVAEDFYYQKPNDVIPSQLAEANDPTEEIIEPESKE